MFQGWGEPGSRMRERSMYPLRSSPPAITLHLTRSYWASIGTFGFQISDFKEGEPDAGEVNVAFSWSLRRTGERERRRRVSGFVCQVWVFWGESKPGSVTGERGLAGKRGAWFCLLLSLFHPSLVETFTRELVTGERDRGGKTRLADAGKVNVSDKVLSARDWQRLRHYHPRFPATTPDLLDAHQVTNTCMPAASLDALTFRVDTLTSVALDLRR